MVSSLFSFLAADVKQGGIPTCGLAGEKASRELEDKK